MLVAVIVNTVVCVLGAIGGWMLAIASLISLANMRAPWVVALMGAGFGVPLVFILSGIGAWVAHAMGATRVTMGLIALPWIYGALFVVAMLLSFRA